MIKYCEKNNLDVQALSSLNIDPKMIVDDYCDYSKVVVRKPWGYEYLIFQNEHVAIWILYLKRNSMTSMHCHPSKKTSLVVLEGEVKCSFLDQTLKCNAGEGLLITKGRFHQSQACSQEGAFLMEIESPVNKRDLVRLKDNYGRVNEGYEDIKSHSLNTQNYNYLSLNNPQASYNCEKRFEKSVLYLKRLQSDDFQSFLDQAHADDILSLLAGEIVNEKKQVVLEIGDSQPITNLRQRGNLFIRHFAEVMLIKKAAAFIRVSDGIAELLHKNGIKRVFSVPGDANVHLIDAIGRHEKIENIIFQSEIGASLAAEGYSKKTGLATALVLSSGASVVRGLAGVANAWVDSSPLLVLSGQARSDQLEYNERCRQSGNKAIHTQALAQAITKKSFFIKTAEQLPEALQSAFALVQSGRPGPVWLDIPIDILGKMVDGKIFSPQNSCATNAPKTSAPCRHSQQISLSVSVEQVIKKLQQAQRPVLLLGNGIRLAQAHPRLEALLNKLKVPALCSRRGADLLSEDHPYFFGRPGSYGQRRANFIIQNSDFVLSIGSRLSIPLIGRNTEHFARKAFKIVVDIDAAELAKTSLKIDLAIEADAGDFIAELDKASHNFQANYENWLQKCEHYKQRFSFFREKYSHTDCINPYLFLRNFSEIMQGDEVLVVDGGSVMNYFIQSHTFKKGQRFISSTGLELPGFALPAAIGCAADLENSRPIFCITDDRGFLQHIQEIQTIVEYKIPIKIIVFQNKGSHNIRKIQEQYFGKRFVGTNFDSFDRCPSALSLAQQYGFETDILDNKDDMDMVIAKFFKSSLSGVCLVNVNSHQEIIPRMEFEIKEDGRWISKPLEDMVPFLSREELRKEMIVELVEEE